MSDVNVESGFAGQMSFRLTWRPYQKRVLDAMSAHLKDRRLHVVAAPGSGKTILGLEALRLIGEPALVLSPTLTIRDQWIDRLTAMFLPEGARKPDWVSTDTRSPQAITSITYQALHMAFTGEADGDDEEAEEESAAAPARRARRGTKVDVMGLLRAAGVRTVVLDECHHLRSEWWRTLIAVLEKLDSPMLVALTATPPYDVPPAEWTRYMALCGPIDAEISVPELVADRNLCAHQDHVFLSSPSGDERALIDRFRADVKAYLATLVTDAEFAAAIGGHPYLADPSAHVEDILERTAYYTSIAIFLQHVRGEAPARLLRCMGLDRERVPAMSEEWWEELLTGCLYDDEEHFEARRETMARVRRDLERIGGVDRRVVCLQTTKKLARVLAASVSKLESIREIVALEHGALGDCLRQVILTDYIRAADMPKTTEDEKPITRLGVVPVFELLRRRGPSGLRLGILCGSLAVLPTDCLPMAKECAKGMGLDPESLGSDGLPHDSRFTKLAISGPGDKRMVRLMTEVFARGGISVLVGTKSLLGEGWDAPTVNSLVLASFVGSYMLSNQMRGRAIRVEKGNPDKTATIWHLACVVDDEDESGAPYAGEDWATMARRFDAFLGPSRNEPVIVSGMERLAIGTPPFTEATIDVGNGEARKDAVDRARLRETWETALALATRHELVHELKADPRALPRRRVLRDCVAVLAAQGAGVLVCALLAAEAGLLAHLLALALAVVLVFALPFFVRALWVLLTHASVAGSLKQVGKAVLKALCHGDLVDTAVHRMRVRSAVEASKTAVLCWLEGGTTFEKTMFLEGLAETLDPVDDPRYLVVRRSLLTGWRPRDFRAVPWELGQKKELAEVFGWMWRRYVGAGRVVYTRNPGGRRLLLRARGESLSAGVPRSERRAVWR